MIGKPIFILSENIEWKGFCRNTHPLAIAVLEEIALTIFEENFVLENESDKLNKINRLHLTNISSNPSALNIIHKILYNSNIFKETTKKILYKGAYYGYIDKHNDLIKQLIFTNLSSNPNAISFLEKHVNNIDWFALSKNPNAISILEANLDKINWINFSENPHPRAIELLEKYPDKINWSSLSANTNSRAIELLEKNIEKINWGRLAGNINPKAIDLLERHFHEIDWRSISPNPSAIHLIEKNMDKIYWDLLSANPNAVHLLEKNLENVNWFWFSKNPNAVSILEKNMEHANYGMLSMNPEAINLLCKLDYVTMKKNMRTMCEELVISVFHPKRLEKICEDYGVDFDDLIEMYG